MTAITADTRVEIERLERKHAENPEGRYFVPLANAYRKSGEVDRAIRVLRQGLAKHPDYVSAHIVLGRCFRDEGNVDAAGAEFQHVLTLDAQNLVALRMLGELAAEDGNDDEARRWYGDLLAVDPMNEEARQALATLAPEDGDATAEPSDSQSEGAAGETAAAQGVHGYPDGMTTDRSHRGPSAGPAGGPLGPQPEFPVYGGGESVVTETIAELYTRQGFYDRAIEVYRELIRRRGDDARLRERLERVQRLAAGEEDPVAPAPASGPTTPSVTAAEGAAAAGPTPSAGPLDPFADSFGEGFVGDGRSRDGSGSRGDGRSTAGLAGAEESPTIRSFLQGVLGWGSPEPTSPGEPPSAEPASEIPGLEPEEQGGAAEPLTGLTPESESPATATPSYPATSAMDGTVTDSDTAVESPPEAPVPADVPAAPAASGPPVEEPPYVNPIAGIPDDELFPWEIPLEDETTGPPATPQSAAPPEPRVSFEDVQPTTPTVAESKNSLEPDPDPTASTPEPVQTVESPIRDATTDVEEARPHEDDDLESFQAWLRSLKR